MDRKEQENIYAVVKRYEKEGVGSKRITYKPDNYTSIFNALMYVSDNDQEIASYGASWCKTASVGDVYEFREGEIEIIRIILIPDDHYYFTISDEESYFVKELTISEEKLSAYLSEYDVDENINQLYTEECKFLVAECVMDEPIIGEYLILNGFLPKDVKIEEYVRTCSKKELSKLIYAIQYTKSFNGYLRYMLVEWCCDNDFKNNDDRAEFVY